MDFYIDDVYYDNDLDMEGGNRDSFAREYNEIWYDTCNNKICTSGMNSDFITIIYGTFDSIKKAVRHYKNKLNGIDNLPKENRDKCLCYDEGCWTRFDMMKTC